MSSEKKIHVFIVDDDMLFLKLLKNDFLQYPEYETTSFATGELCLEKLNELPDVIILDYYLNGLDIHAMNGIEILDKIKAYNPDIPVIMLSTQDKIEVAIECMHHRAFDYVVKSETAFMRIQRIINSIARFKKMDSILNWYKARM
jgi:DNA-binding NtrC family response regulator